ncbi:MAG: PEP-CTERM sorting domain-containing protein [Rubrivivax sp.]|nr:PEP-CTERM sorting domain-containing protein [Rubrivivax sp.]
MTALDPLTSSTVRYFEDGSVTLVPEPATWLMWLAGGALLLGAAKARRPQA